MAAGKTQEADATAAREVAQPQPLREPEAAGEQPASGHAPVSPGPSHEEEADAHGGAQQEDEHGPMEGLEEQEKEGYDADEEEVWQEEEDSFMAEMEAEEDSFFMAEEEDAEEDATTHLLFVPPDESSRCNAMGLRDDTTTVRPTYTLSQIKKIIPQGSDVEKKFNEKQAIPEEMNVSSDDAESTQPDNEDPWEESGCILWRLASSKPEAELMIKNLVLEVLLTNLHVANSSRVKEICLGIMAKLACHKSLVNTICLENGLIATVVEQLFLDDTSCLSETFRSLMGSLTSCKVFHYAALLFLASRLLTAILKGSASISWVEALLPDKILSCILWIVVHTTSSALLEQGIEFISTIIDHQDVIDMLIQPLLKVGLVDYATRLVATEIKKSPEEKLDRSGCLNMILHLMEELSAIHSVAEIMSSNDQLIELLVNMVKSPDKLEVAAYFASVVIIIDNILTDGRRRLVPMLFHDLPLVEGLFSILPQVSDDNLARRALWCTLSCLLAPVGEVEMNSSSLDQFASLFLGMFTLIKDDLDSHCIDGNAIDDAFMKGHTHTCLRAIGFVMVKWVEKESSPSEKDAPVIRNSFDKANELVDYCMEMLS